jgi:hypothetical protein
MAADAAPMAACSSRMFRGGGKYSSSSVTLTGSTPWRGASRWTMSSTSSSGADAPAVTPTVPCRSSGSSSALLTRNTRGQPASIASFSRARVLEELDEPITTMASQRDAIAMSADWRFVVAKHRSLRPGVQASGYLAVTASATPAQSRCDNVVWARSATG